MKLNISYPIAGT